MNDPSGSKSWNDHAEIISLLRTIRSLLIALLLGVAVSIALHFDIQFAMLLAIVGPLVWLLAIIAGATIKRARRKQDETVQFRQLSGR